jgi:hypothetical protein
MVAKMDIIHYIFSFVPSWNNDAMDPTQRYFRFFHSIVCYFCSYFLYAYVVWCFVYNHRHIFPHSWSTFYNTILFGIDIIPFSGLRYLYLDIFGMDAIPFFMVMFCIAGALLIILNFFPTLFGLLKSSHPMMQKKEKNYLLWIPRSISLLSTLVLMYLYDKKNFGMFGSGYRDPLIEILIAFLLVAFVVSVWAKKYIAILYFFISFTGFLMVYLPLKMSGSPSSGSPLEHNISIFVVLLVPVVLVTTLFYVFTRKTKNIQTHTP